MLGISVYFKDLDLDYLKKASECHVEYVFTSLYIMEENYQPLKDKIPVFLNTCKELGLKAVPDVSPATFEKLNIPEKDYHALRELGFEALRLDYGFDDFEVLKELQKDFYLMLNASVVDKDYLLKAKIAGVDMNKLALTHNFYPQRGTGLGLDFFNQKNKDFLELGIPVQVFICGDGLPTLEKHRQVHPLCATVELVQRCGIHDILIGDSKANIDTLRSIDAYLQHKELHIKAHLNEGYKDLYGKKIGIRKDLADKVIRLAEPRKPDVVMDHMAYRPKGCITMANYLYGRYSGEIQITKEDLEMDPKVNVIGYIHPKMIELIDYIDANTTLVFEEM